MVKTVLALCACLLFAAVAASHALAAPYTPPPYGTFISWQDDTQVVVAWYHDGINLGTFYVYRSSDGIIWDKIGQHGYSECCGYWWIDTTAGTSDYGYRITVDAPDYDESAPSNEVWRFSEPPPMPTPTPTGGITSTIPYVVVQIPGGQAQPAIYVIYSLTIGEIILAAVILLLVLVISGRWLYDVAMDVFQVRNAAIGSWVSRKLYKRWINRMVE